MQEEGSGPSGAMTTTTTEPQICKETGLQDYAERDDGIKTEDRAEENEEQIKEYLKRTDTAVIFPEPVSVSGLKDCLKNDEEQEKPEKKDDMKSKVASASEYSDIMLMQFSRKLLCAAAMFCDADPSTLSVPTLSSSSCSHP